MSTSESTQTVTRRTLARRVLVGSGGLAGVGLLAACGVTGNGASAAPPSSSANAAPVTVELRHNGVSDAQMAKWRPVFEAAQAQLPKYITLHATFETDKMWDKLQVEHAGGTGPDVVYNQVNWYITGGVNGIFHSLNTYMARDKVKRESYNPGAMRSWIWKDKVYALPYSAGGETAFLNKRLFQEMALPLPKVTWTWDELLTAAQKLTKGEGLNKQFGVVLFNNALQITQGTWMLNNGGQVLNEARDKALYGDDPKSIAAFEWLVNLRVKHGVEPKNEEKTPNPSKPNTTLQPFNEGRAAIEIGRFSRYNEWIDVLGKDQIEIMPVPVGPSGRRVSAVGTNGWSVGGHTEVPDAAWEVVKWLTGPQGQSGVGADAVGVPALISAASDPQFLKRYAGTKAQQTFAAWSKDSHDYFVNPDATEAWKAHTKEAAAAFDGTKTPREALRDSAAALNIIFDRRPANLR